MEAKLLSTAKLGKTHGLDGYLRVYSLSGEYNHLKKLKECNVVLPDKSELSLSVDSISTQGELFLMRFSGYDTPEKARKLSKGIIRISRSNAPKLEKGEFYIADLYDMEVIHDGVSLGKVVATIDGPQALLLEILRYDNEKKYLVPLLPVYISNVNVKENTLELLMAELLD